MPVRDGHHMKNLKNLNCSRTCGITQKGLSECINIIILDASYNENIISVNHMGQLEELYCCYYCGIDEKGVANCKNIKKISAMRNSKIKSIGY